jgi:glutathione S-transferase
VIAPSSERLTLHSQSHSPYARKTIVFAHEAGIADRLAIIDQETSPTNRNPEVCAVNPLGKVPVLITPEAGAIFDSLVICDYLDGLHAGSRLIPRAGRHCACMPSRKGSAMPASPCAGRPCGGRSICAIRP